VSRLFSFRRCAGTAVPRHSTAEPGPDSLELRCVTGKAAKILPRRVHPCASLKNRVRVCATRFAPREDRRNSESLSPGSDGSLATSEV
jgi:hypothetical protein